MGGQIIGLADNINQIDKVITFVPSYGNWQNNAPKGRWKMGFLWATVFPLMALIAGYFPASRLNLGHDWPKGVTWDWWSWGCLLYTSPSPRDATLSRMPSSA